METWRVVATALLAAAGLVLIPAVMAKVRDATRSAAQTWIGGLVTFTALLVLGVLMVTVLPGVLTWVIVALTAVAASVMLLAN